MARGRSQVGYTAAFARGFDRIRFGAARAARRVGRGLTNAMRRGIRAIGLGGGGGSGG